MGHRLAAAVVLLSSCVLGPARARADEVHHQVLVGDRSLGLGGAFTGVADDPSAAFYNPAGLANLPDNGVSTSLSLHTFVRREIEDGFGSPTGLQDLSHTARRSVPVFVSLVRKLGARDEDGIRRHALALSTFHPDRTHYSFRVDALDASRTTRDTLHVSHEDRSIWFGLSYAFRPRPDISTGLSLFVSSRRMTHLESRTLLEASTPVVGGPLTDLRSAHRESEVDLTAWHLVLRLGGTYRPIPELQLGATFQPPGIALETHAVVEERRIGADLTTSPPQADFFDSRQQVGASSPIPWMLRVGAAWEPAEPWLLSLDLSLHGPDRDAERVLHGLEPDSVTGRVPEPGTFFPPVLHRHATFNAAAGAEVVIADKVTVRAGGFTDLSAAPSIDGPSDRYAFDDTNRLGGTVALGFRSQDWDLGAGFGGWVGWGDALGLDPAARTDPTAPRYVPTSVRDRAIFVYVTGYKRVATHLLTRVARQARPQGGGEGDTGSEQP